MTFGVQRIQKYKLVILNIKHKDKPVIVDANWEIQIIAMIQRHVSIWSFEYSSNNIFISFIRILEQILLWEMNAKNYDNYLKEVQKL